MNVILNCVKISFQGKSNDKLIKKLSDFKYSKEEIEESLSQLYVIFEETKDYTKADDDNVNNALSEAYPTDYAKLSRLDISLKDIGTYERIRKEVFEYYKNCSSDVFRNSLIQQEKPQNIPSGDEIMTAKEKDEYLSMVKMFYTEGTPQEYQQFSLDSEHDYKRFMISADNNDFLKYLEITMPDVSEIYKNKNAFMSFLLLIASSKSSNFATNNIVQFDNARIKQWFIGELLNFEYTKIESSKLVEDKRDTDEKFCKYLRRVKEFYDSNFSKEDCKKLIEMFKNSNSQDAAKLMSNVSHIAIDKSFAQDIWINFIKESIQNTKPNSISINGEDIYCVGFEDCKIQEMPLYSMKGFNLQNLLECGFFTKEAVRVLKLKIDLDNLSPFEKHNLCEEIAQKYQDSRNFHNSLNKYLDSDIEMQNDIKKIYGLVNAMDEKANKHFNFIKSLDISKVSFSKHALLRLISRNLINPKHKALGFVDFDSLINSIEAGLIKSKGQSYTIPELGGYSGLRVVVNNNQITTIY